MATKVAVTSAMVDKKELASTPAPVAANNSDGDPINVGMGYPRRTRAAAGLVPDFHRAFGPNPAPGWSGWSPSSDR